VIHRDRLGTEPIRGRSTRSFTTPRSGFERSPNIEPFEDDMDAADLEFTRRRVNVDRYWIPASGELDHVVVVDRERRLRMASPGGARTSLGPALVARP
jgi:hypothetical protein